MLPDYPKTKQRIRTEFFMRPMSMAARTFINADEPPAVLHEGHKQKIDRLDGGTHFTDFQHKGTDITLTSDEIKRMTVQALFELAISTGEKMRIQLTKLVFDEMNRVTAATGQIVDHHGRPFSPQTWFEMIENIQMSFNPDGTPIWPSLVIPPELKEPATKAFQEILENPKLLREFENLVIRKREDFREREIDRKLAD